MVHFDCSSHILYRYRLEQCHYADSSRRATVYLYDMRSSFNFQDTVGARDTLATLAVCACLCGFSYLYYTPLQNVIYYIIKCFLSFFDIKI